MAKTRSKTTRRSTTAPRSKSGTSRKSGGSQTARTAKPKTTKPKTAKPKTAKPKTARPKTAKPKTARPKTAKPKTAKAKTTKPKTTKPKTAKPKTSGSSGARPTPDKQTGASAPAKGQRAREKDTTKKSNEKSTGKSAAAKAGASKTTAAKGAKAAKAAKGEADAPVRKPAAKTAAERRLAVTPFVPTVEAKPRSRRKKGPYSLRQLNPLRKALMELRARIARDLNLMGDEAFRASDPEVDSDDVADMGSDAFERTMTLNLMEKDATNLKKVHEALDLMNEGTYGLCVECNESIPLPRLEALPFAQTCVPCQEQQERLL